MWRNSRSSGLDMHRNIALLHADLAAGARKHAVGFSNLQDVQRVDDALRALEDSCTDPSTPQPVISVVGAGYSGVELAATVAERMKGCAAVHLLAPNGELLPVCAFK